MTVAELLAAFVQNQADLGRNERTVHVYRRELGIAIALWGADLDCHAITYAHCQAYHATHEHLAPSTRSERFILLRQWLAWGLKQGYLWKNPLQGQKERIVRPAIAWVPNEDQVHQLLALPERDTVGGLRDAVALEMLYGTGLRRHEMVALNLNDWLSEQRGIWVHGKGDKPRLQPVGEHLSQLIDRYLGQSRPQLLREQSQTALLLGDQGQRFPYHQLGLFLHGYCQLAKLPTMTPHVLRRAYATHLLLRGADLREVQALLGHADPHVTERYTKIEVMELKREYQRTHPRASLRRLPGGTKPLGAHNPKTLPKVAD